MPSPIHRTPHELIAFCEDIEKRIKPGVLVCDTLSKDIGIVLDVQGEYCRFEASDHKWKVIIKWNSKTHNMPSFMGEFEAGWVEIISENS
jgi:hypothetical protein